MKSQFNKRPRKHLATKLIGYIILFSVAVSLAATTIQVKMQYDHEIGDVQNRFALSQESHLSAITTNLWLLDKERLQILLHGISLLPDFQYAEVTNETGEVVAAIGVKREADTVILSTDLTHEHRGKTLTLGRFVLAANHDEAFSTVAKNAMFILAFTSLITFFLAVIIYILVHRVVTRHMAHMAAYAREFSFENIDRELTLEREEKADGEDELNELVAAINAMRLSLKTSYEEMNNLNEQLELRVTETELANQAKADFLASMSHELRTPLNAILGFAQMLKLNPKEPLSKMQTEYLNDIIAGGVHLLDLVNDVLDLVKIEANQVVLLMEHIYVNDIINKSVALIKPAAAARRITVIDRMEGKPPFRIRADALRLKQALINVLSNAVKYNVDDGEVILDSAETQDGYLHISITDTGIGIDEDRQKDVFEIFSRMEADPMKAVEGTGIGLAVTKQLVERMGGRIGFKSIKGKGSIFWIDIPLSSKFGQLIWEDGLSFGIAAMDTDHKKLISFLNKLTDRTVSRDDMNGVVTELTDYILYHFRREEAVMAACDYPDLEEHKATHQKLAVEANLLAERWRACHDPEVKHEMLEFLRAWLAQHIIKDDADIGPFVRGKEAEIKRALAEIEA